VTQRMWGDWFLLSEAETCVYSRSGFPRFACLASALRGAGRSPVFEKVIQGCTRRFHNMEYSFWNRHSSVHFSARRELFLMLVLLVALVCRALQRRIFAASTVRGDCFLLPCPRAAMSPRPLLPRRNACYPITVATTTYPITQYRRQSNFNSRVTQNHHWDLQPPRKSTAAVVMKAQAAMHLF
jgi:hypothetical protein